MSDTCHPTEGTPFALSGPGKQHRQSDNEKKKHCYQFEEKNKSHNIQTIFPTCLAENTPQIIPLSVSHCEY